MLQYFKMLLVFVLSIVINKNELNFGHKDFNPGRVVVIIFLLLNLAFSGYLMHVLYLNGKLIEQQCGYDFGYAPELLKDSAKKENK